MKAVRSVIATGIARPRVGIGFGATGLRALCVHRGRVNWAVERDIAPDEPVAEAIAAFVASLPLRRWPATPVVAALGPSRAQLRGLEGLPPVASAAALGELLQANQARFFRRNGVPLVVGFARAGTGTPFVAAYHAPELAALDAACTRAGATLVGVAPIARLLPRHASSDELRWMDGEVSCTVRLDQGTLIGVRTLPRAADGPDGTAAISPAALQPLGDAAARFLDAWAAAMASPDDLDPPRAAKRDSIVPRWRLATAAVALSLSMLAALAAPAVRDALEVRRLTASLQELAPARTRAARARIERQAAAGAIAVAARSTAGDVAPLLLLDRLTGALPEGAAVISLRADSAAATVVALVPRAAVFLAALERMPGVIAPEVVGPVTRESAAAREMDRATIRFRFARERAMAAGEPAR